MKKLFLIFMFTTTLTFAFEAAAARVLGKYFTQSTIQTISKTYGKSGVKALERLSAKYGKQGLDIMKRYTAQYGQEGLSLLARYGEKALANKTTFEMVKRYGDKGFYLVRQYPARSVKYYEQYGDTFVRNAQKVGSGRMMRYMDGAAKYGKEEKVLHFLDKFGEKANVFLDRHWGKLLTGGFVLLNADDFMLTAQNVANHTVDKVGDAATEGLKAVADSQLGWFIGLALLLFVFFKYGIDAIGRVWKRRSDRT